MFDCSMGSCGAAGLEPGAACGLLASDFLACDKSKIRLSPREVGLLSSLDCPDKPRPCSWFSAEFGGRMIVGDILELPGVGCSPLFTIQDLSSLSSTSDSLDGSLSLDGSESLLDTSDIAESTRARFDVLLGA